MPPLKKRVLLIAPQPFFESRGTPLNVRAMVETLARSTRYEVDLLVFPFGTPYSHEAVRVLRCPRPPFVSSVPVGPSFQKLFLDCALFRTARSLSEKHPYDYFHGVEEGAFIATWLAKKFGKPLICDMDSCMPTQLEQSRIFGTTLASKLFRYLERRSISESAAVLTVCSALSDKVRALAPDVALHQIEDFPAEGSERGDPETIARLRKELEVSQNSVLFMYTGNFERYQGIDLLLKSFARLKDQPQLRLALVGGGTLDHPAVVRYRSLAQSLGIADRTAFCGSRPQSEIGSYMALADVLVSPRIEGDNTPLKLYSYMASGTPIVATDIHSHTQVLHSGNAILAAPEPEAFGAALLAAADASPEAKQRRQQRCAMAKREVEEKYSREAFEKRLLTLYDSLQQPQSVCTTARDAAAGSPLSETPTSESPTSESTVVGASDLSARTALDSHQD